MREPESSFFLFHPWPVFINFRKTEDFSLDAAGAHTRAWRVTLPSFIAASLFFRGLVVRLLRQLLLTKRRRRFATGGFRLFADEKNHMKYTVM
ncbi:hypothetical protein E2320_011249 [Naja naja]|nr:hypothetical protein E2320_011249 [Naja naja]